MNTLLEEMAKQAYSKNVHRRLMSKTVQTAFGGDIGRAARDTMIQGALESDTGLRHPWMPWNDVQHAFPSVTKKEMGREIRIMRNDALKSLTRAIGDESLGKLRRNTMMVQGLLGVGHAQHAQMDVGAHNLKPLEISKGDPSAMKSMKKMRRVIRSLPGYYGGIVSSASEHMGAGAGLTGNKGAESARAHIDRLQPTKYKSDQATVRNASTFGKGLRGALLQQLRHEHGLKRPEAEELMRKRLREFKPNRLERAAGGVLDTAQHAVQQVQRLKRLPEVMKERKTSITRAAEGAMEGAVKTAEEQDQGKVTKFLRKAGPGIGGALGAGVGALAGARRGKLLKGALMGLGTGATLGWVPDMAHGVREGVQELR